MIGKLPPANSKFEEREKEEEEAAVALDEEGVRKEERELRNGIVWRRRDSCV